nr:unnamed protein product [Callosobruchus analis]
MSSKFRRLLSFNVNQILKRKYHKNEFVRVVEVGPRDGLQNEPINVPTEVKIEFINKLSETGLETVEVTSFVSPKWVPQMGDNSEVYTGIKKKENVNYPVLVPNVQGLEEAVKCGVREIAVFTSASEGFSKKNTNCSIQESLRRIEAIAQEAKKHHLRVRGYVSCIVGCPYDGAVHPSSVTKVTEALLSLGCYEVSLGDTIGVGTKQAIRNVMKDILDVATADKVAIHCHDTYGQALPNICTALEYGVRVVDSSVAGLGGCPYAKGATGNVATEDLIYMLHGMGMETGVDLRMLIEAGRYVCRHIKRQPASKVNNALYSKYGLE